MFKRLIVLTVLVVMVVTFMASSAAQETVTIKVMNWSGEQTDFYQDVAEAFNAEYPNIELEVEIMAQANYRESLPLLFQQDAAPDVFFWISQSNRVLTTAELRDLGWISPLNPEGVSEEFMARWPGNSFLEGINVFDGEVYSFPFNDNKIWGPGYMYYDRQAFELAGLDPDSPPTTWNELRETCETIVSTGGAPFCMAVPLKGVDFQRTWFPIAGSIMTDAGSFFDYQNGRFAIDDPRLIRAFEFLQGMYNDELFVPGVEDKAFARQAVGNGLAAIYFGGAWMPGVFRSMGFEDLDLGVAAPPVPDDGPYGSLAQTPSENKYFVSSQTEHPEEAWLFLEWMTRPDGYFAQNYLAQGFGTLAFADNGEYLTDPVMVEMANNIAPDLRVMYPEPVLRCPDAARSEAFRAAREHHPNWEWEAMVEALVNDSDFSEVAIEIAATKNEIFQDTVEQEAADGLDISMECFTYPEFDFTTDFDPANY